MSAENANQNNAADAYVTENTLFAEPVYHIGSLPLTNSMINSWIVVLFLVAVSFVVRKRMKFIPRGFQNFIEIVVEYIYGIIYSVTNDKKVSYKYLPLIFCLFVFIISNNWLGLLPGVGSIGQIADMHGKHVFIPYLRGGTADINATLGLAMFGVLATHVFGVISLGAWSYLNKFIKIKTVMDIPAKLKHGAMTLIESPIDIFIGLVELLGEITKMASLSLRLFGNIYAGEVLLASIAGMVALFAPIPFMFLELFVGYVQALVFSSLIMSYLAVAVESHDHPEGAHH